MPTPTQTELEILNVLWQVGEARVQDIHLQLSQHRDIGYTSTLKSMQIMAQKGLLQRRLEGRSHVYFPAVEEQDTKNNLLTRFIDNTFGGSTSQLIMQALGNSNVSEDEVKAIRAFLDNHEDNLK